MKKLLLTTALSLFSVVSWADSFSRFYSDFYSDFGLYVGAGLGLVSTQAEDAFGREVNFKVGEVLGGARWRWIGIEARTGRSSEDEVIDLGLDGDGNFVTARTALTNYETVFLRFQLENEIARIYLLAGRSEVFTTTTQSTGTIINVSAVGDAYGVGAGFEVNERLFFNLEFKSLFESEDLSLPMVGATIDYHVF